MAYTSISDIFQSETFKEYAREQTVALNGLIQSGAMINNQEFNNLITNDRAMLVEMPFWKPLTGDDEVVRDDTALTVNALSNDKQLAVKLIRAKTFGMTDLAGVATGSNKEQVIAAGLAEYWNDRTQSIVVSILSGLFKATGALSSHLVNESTQVISDDMIMDVEHTMGDHYGKLNVIAMHSDVYNKLRKLQLIDTVQSAINPAATFESYQGKRVIVDDACPVNDGVYDTYLFGPGAFAYGTGAIKDGNLPEYEVVREGLNNRTAVISRRCMIVHPVGFKYVGSDVTSTTTPSNTELATANKWELAYNHKNVPMVCLRARVAPGS